MYLCSQGYSDYVCVCLVVLEGGNEYSQLYFNKILEWHKVKFIFSIFLF